MGHFVMSSFFFFVSLTARFRQFVFAVHGDPHKFFSKVEIKMREVKIRASDILQRQIQAFARKPGDVVRAEINDRFVNLLQRIF